MKRQLILSVFAIFLIGITSTTFAQQRDWDRNDRRDNREYRRYSKDEIREMGARRGYEIGNRSGSKDARGGYKLDYKRDADYKFGLIGYRGEFQHDGAYKDGFRKGFERGYREAYEREYYNNRRGGIAATMVAVGATGAGAITATTDRDTKKCKAETAIRS